MEWFRLAGTVDVYGVKADAEKKAHKAKGVAAVRDDIQVGGPAIADQVLQNKLIRTIQTETGSAMELRRSMLFR